MGNTVYKRLAAPKTPIVSNAHLLAYGSGLLYNITPTGTESEFKYPLVGISAGLTFFNDLDLNFSYGVPIISGLELQDYAKTPFFNIGFDIQFTEYIKRANHKRQAKKQVKQLAGVQTTETYKIR
jgi:hypothetical protein